jgi:hypothetical protein
VSFKGAKTDAQRARECRLRKKFDLVRVGVDMDADELADALWRIGTIIRTDDTEQLSKGVEHIVLAFCHVVTGAADDIAYAVRESWSGSSVDEDPPE